MTMGTAAGVRVLQDERQEGIAMNRLFYIAVHKFRPCTVRPYSRLFLSFD